MAHSGVRAIYRARGAIRVQKGAYLAVGFASGVLVKHASLACPRRRRLMFL